MKLGTNIHRIPVHIAEMVSRSAVKGQGHSEIKCTFAGTLFDGMASRLTCFSLLCCFCMRVSTRRCCFYTVVTTRRTQKITPPPATSVGISAVSQIFR